MLRAFLIFPCALLPHHPYSLHIITEQYINLGAYIVRLLIFAVLSVILLLSPFWLQVFSPALFSLTQSMHISPYSSRCPQVSGSYDVQHVLDYEDM